MSHFIYTLPPPPPPPPPYTLHNTDLRVVRPTANLHSLPGLLMVKIVPQISPLVWLHYQLGEHLVMSHLINTLPPPPHTHTLHNTDLQVVRQTANLYSLPGLLMVKIVPQISPLVWQHYQLGEHQVMSHLIYTLPPPLLHTHKHYKTLTYRWYDRLPISTLYLGS